MLLYQNGIQINDISEAPQGRGDIICIAPEEERNQAFAALGMETPQLYGGAGRVGTYHERRGATDCFFLNIPGEDQFTMHRVEAFFAEGRLLLLNLYEALQARLQEWMQATPAQAQSASKTLGAFFSLLLSGSVEHLENLDSAIEDLEDGLGEEAETPSDYPKEIRLLRKKLLVQKRYYEALLSLFEELEESGDDSLDHSQQAYLQYLTRRTDRIYHMVLSLREYLAHVSEAYQSQTDIELNRVMKFFTVITAIFLPLTLIVGWYGMNFTMPEYRSPYAYPVVIIVSLVIVIGSILYFKKKKWF